MLNNPGIQANAAIAWTGAASIPRRIHNFIDFGFIFEVTQELTAPAVFAIQFHDDANGDPCVPGAGVDATEKPSCDASIADTGVATITLPTGTQPNSFCPVAPACKEGRWISLRHISGGANVRAVAIMTGPKRVY
jgi:hypothetical protein